MGPRPSRPSSARAPLAPASPRAKALVARDLQGPSRQTRRALDRFGEALAAFDAACEDRSGLGLIDERYGDLGACAAAVVRCLVDERDRGFLDEPTSQALERHLRSGRAPGDDPEADVDLARSAYRAGDVRRASS